MLWINRAFHPLLFHSQLALRTSDVSKHVSEDQVPLVPLPSPRQWESTLSAQDALNSLLQGSLQGTQQAHSGSYVLRLPPQCGTGSARLPAVFLPLHACLSTRARRSCWVSDSLNYMQEHGENDNITNGSYIFGARVKLFHHHKHLLKPQL